LGFIVRPHPLKSDMKSTSRRWNQICAVLVACLHLGAVAQEVPTVQKVVIVHVGPANVSDALIRANMRVKEGEVFSQDAVDADVQNLHKTGFFQNIRVGQERDARGVTLTYRLQAKPVLTEIRFSGNKKYSSNKLRKKLTSKVGEPLDQLKLFNDSQEILKMYQKAGLQKTEVVPVPAINEELGRGIVTFEVREAPKIRIKDVTFDGAKDMTTRKLRRVVKTRRWWMFSWITGSGKLKDDVFEEDKERLREFYTEQGYIDFELKDVKFESTTTNRMVVRFQIEEGTPYRVGGVRFQGNQLFSREEIIGNLRTRDGDKIKRGLVLKDGEKFTPKGLQRDVDSIRDFYSGRGYIDVVVEPEKVPNVEKGTLDLNYRIEEGEKAFVEKIEIKGNVRTRDKVIRRELAIAPGETFDMVRVKLSKNRLEQMQYFEKVETTPEDTEIPNRKNLVIGVEEKRTGNAIIGAGFSSIDALVGFVEVSQGNFDLFNPPTFTGGGQKARLRLQAGTRRQDYVATFIEPWFLGRRLSLSTELFHRQLNFLSDNYEQSQTGGKVGLTSQLPFNLIGGVNYTLESINLDFDDSYKAQYRDSVVLQEAGRRLVSRVGATLAYDTRNSYQLPTKGQRIELLPELAGGPFGGDSDYYRVEMRVSQYWNPGQMFTETSYWQDVFEGHVLELTGRIGVVEAYGDGDRGRRDRVPLFDRWYLGGLTSLRGYRFRQVGPRDPISGEPTGGGTYWFGGAEYSVPIIERLRFAVFYDVGMVYPDAFSLAPQDYVDFNGKRQTTRLYSDNWGVGLRLNLPIGPLRLDYGIPMTHDTRVGGGGRFQFGVGYTRDF
jgi:outer membrane protein insertion porin family